MVVNQQLLRDRMHSATKMRQTGEILRSAAHGQSEATDRANKGFSYYLRGVEMLEHSPSGARGNFDRDFRQLGGEGRPDQGPPGPAEPVPGDGLGALPAGPSHRPASLTDVAPGWHNDRPSLQFMCP